MAKGTPDGPALTRSPGCGPGRSPGPVGRWLPLLAIIALAAAFFLFGLQRYLSWENLRAHHVWLAAQVAAHLPLALLAYALIYAAVVALSLPGASALTLAGGWLFGQLLGTAVTVLAATGGATLLFLAARSALADSLEQRAGPWLRRLEAGFRANAFSYLLFLRLVPLFPFFVVNLVPAFAGVGLRSFVLATLLGIIPGTFIYATAGAGLGDVLAQGGEVGLGQILNPRIVTALAGLAVLALLPVAVRFWRSRRPRGGGLA
jgi:uncharacterized membrane protein YdjX (TVP38/TMEM64 family)